MFHGRNILAGGMSKKRIRNYLMRKDARGRVHYRKLGSLTSSEKYYGVDLKNLRRLESVNDFVEFRQYARCCHELTRFGYVHV